MDQIVARLKECLLLKLCLEAHITHMHSFSLNLIKSLLNVGMLNPIPKSSLYTIKLALLHMGKQFAKEPIPVGTEIYNLLPFFESTRQVNGVEPSELIGEDPLGLCEQKLFSLRNTLLLICA
jgi:hypothetical protein